MENLALATLFCLTTVTSRNNNLIRQYQVANSRDPVEIFYVSLGSEASTSFSNHDEQISNIKLVFYLKAEDKKSQG